MRTTDDRSSGRETISTSAKPYIPLFVGCIRLANNVQYTWSWTTWSDVVAKGSLGMRI
jgi:hypothetical protein